MSISFRTTKLPSLKWKNQPKTPLGYLPLAFEPLDTTILKMRAGEKGQVIFPESADTKNNFMALAREVLLKGEAQYG